MAKKKKWLPMPKGSLRKPKPADSYQFYHWERESKAKWQFKDHLKKRRKR